MKYCVVKDTVTIIDGSENSDEIMLQNSLNSGFRKDDVEILTEEEFNIRLSSLPIPIERKTELEILKEKIAIQDSAIMELAEIISNMSGGI